jgi:hypothetical protein
MANQRGAKHVRHEKGLIVILKKVVEMHNKEKQLSEMKEMWHLSRGEEDYVGRT